MTAIAPPAVRAVIDAAIVDASTAQETPQKAAERVLAYLAADGYRIQPDTPPKPQERP